MNRSLNFERAIFAFLVIGTAISLVAGLYTSGISAATPIVVLVVLLPAVMVCSIVDAASPRWFQVLIGVLAIVATLWSAFGWVTVAAIRDQEALGIWIVMGICEAFILMGAWVGMRILLFLFDRTEPNAILLPRAKSLAQRMHLLWGK